MWIAVAFIFGMWFGGKIYSAGVNKYLREAKWRLNRLERLIKLRDLYDDAKRESFEVHGEARPHQQSGSVSELSNNEAVGDNS